MQEALGEKAATAVMVVAVTVVVVVTLTVVVVATVTAVAVVAVTVLVVAVAVTVLVAEVAVKSSRSMRRRTSHPGGRFGLAGKSASLQLMQHTETLALVTTYCPYLPHS